MFSRTLRRLGRDSHGFTLVELLVVIGIISALIAIVMPVVGRVREHANRVKCAANLRSLGHALTMYVQQYRYYPSSQLIVGGAAYEAAVWPVRLRPFLAGQQNVFYCPSRDERFKWTSGDPAPVVGAYPPYTEVGYEPGEPLLHMNATFSYGYNGGGFGGMSLKEQKGLGGWPKVASIDFGDAGEMPASRVKMPAEMVAISDSDGDGLQDYLISLKGDAPRAWPGDLHSHGANVLFCDGHVSWYLQQDLVINDPPSDIDKPKIRMWNNDHRANGDPP